MVTRIAYCLAKNLRLTKPVSLAAKIHEATISLAHSLCSRGQLSPSDSLSLPNLMAPRERNREVHPKLLQDVGTSDDLSVQNLCLLSLNVLQGRAGFKALQRSTMKILEHTGSFSVDHLLLLLCPYAACMDSYSKWYKVHNGDFIRAINTYNRQILIKLPDMTLEQLHFMIYLFNIIAKRHEHYSLQDSTLLNTILSRLLLFAKQLPAELAKSYTQDRTEKVKLQGKCKELSSTLQTLYKCYYPYYEAVHTTLGPQRMHIKHLVGAALYMQSFVEKFNLLDGFEKLCQSFSLDTLQNVSMESAIKIVTLFGRNGKLYTDKPDIMLSDTLIDELAKKLHSLTIYEYICDRDVRQGVLQLLTQVLDHVGMEDLHDCLDVLWSSNRLNEHMHTLFLPFIIDSLGAGTFSTRDLLNIMRLGSDSAFCHWTMWLIYYSHLNVDSPKLYTDLDLLDGLCESTIVQNQKLTNAKDIEELEQPRFIHVTKIGEYDPERDCQSVTFFEALTNTKHRKLYDFLVEYSKCMDKIEHHLEINKHLYTPLGFKDSIHTFNKHFSIAN